MHRKQAEHTTRHKASLPITHLSDMMRSGFSFLPVAILIVSSLSLCHALIMTSSTDAAPHLRFFIGGLGYCGSRLATKLRQEFPDCEIAGCVRSESRKQSFDSSDTNARVHVLDLDQNYRGLNEEGLNDLLQATHIVQTIAPIADFDRDPLLATHGEALLSNNNDASKNLKWVGYLSSTGVYGDHGGDWVDETTSELKCRDAKSLARVKTEKEWRELERRIHESYDHTTNTRIDCFRCGGIYGPGRGPLFSDSLMSAAAAPPSDVKDNEPKAQVTATINDIKDEILVPKYVNRILVDDICTAVVAAVKASLDEEASSNSHRPGKIYNLVDDDPAPRQDVVAEARRLRMMMVEETTTSTTRKEEGSSHDDPPPTMRRRQRPTTTSRNTGNKRCCNQLLKDDYGWEQIAPTYREGLAYLLRQQQ